MNDYLDQDRPAWEILDDESTLWYSRFDRYLTIGPSRSINEAAIQTTGENATPQWYTVSREYRWKDRAMAYDNEQARLRRVEIEAARWKARQDRIKILNAVFERLISAVEFLDPEMISWHSFAPILRSFMEASRNEFENEKIDLNVSGGMPQILEGEMQDAKDRLFRQLFAVIESRRTDTSDSEDDANGGNEGYIQLGSLVPPKSEDS